MQSWVDHSYINQWKLSSLAEIGMQGWELRLESHQAWSNLVPFLLHHYPSYPLTHY